MTVTMFGLDRALKLPAEIARETAKTVAQLPTLPLEVAEKGFEGLQDGIEKATDPKKH